ncbi:MAG: hypothetical protein N0E54_02995 [Candidatus Thiodiazotropha taylori]|nr:hypothetical protein [Candidatus Thiodiazotropha endolucinida]MCW4227693.1 hypothetical protein [Candidatus Thiodiazotropha taylori]
MDKNANIISIFHSKKWKHKNKDDSDNADRHGANRLVTYHKSNAYFLCVDYIAERTIYELNKTQIHEMSINRAYALGQSLRVIVNGKVISRRKDLMSKIALYDRSGKKHIQYISADPITHDQENKFDLHHGARSTIKLSHEMYIRLELLKEVYDIADDPRILIHLLILNCSILKATDKHLSPYQDGSMIEKEYKYM